MYYPPFREQLTGIATQHVDCGVRITQMGINWLSKGEVTLSVKQIREAMGDQDQTNYQQWDELIDDLGGLTLGFRGELTNSWPRCRDHLDAQGAVMFTVHYGTERKHIPNKVGSKTFSGYHAELYIGSRRRNGVRQTRKFDSLNDGRYKGCPNGPVWAPTWALREAGWEVGQREAGKDKVYAVLLHRDTTIAPVEPGDLVPDGAVTLSDLLGDLADIQAESADEKVDELLEEAIDGLEALIGINANPEADEDTPVESGITV